MVSVLIAAGGEPIERHTQPGYKGKIADILFPADDVIVEVKSLTTDRAASDETSEAVGEMFSRHTHMGAPVIFGTVTVITSERTSEANPISERSTSPTIRLAAYRGGAMPASSLQPMVP